MAKKIRAEPKHPQEFAPDLENLRRGDEQQNWNSTPPESEYIGLRCVWGVEFYTPANLEILVSSFEAINAGQGYHFDSLSDPVDWLRSWQRNNLGGSWTNLGFFVPEGRPRPLSHYRVVELPEYFEYAYGGMYSVTSTLTAIVLCFVVKSELVDIFDQEVRKPRITDTTRLERGYRINDPLT